MGRHQSIFVHHRGGGRSDLGIGRTLGYELGLRAEFLIRILRLGRLYRVPMAFLERLLGATNDAGYRMTSPERRHLKDKSRKSQMARTTSTREVADSDVLDITRSVP